MKKTEIKFLKKHLRMEITLSIMRILGYLWIWYFIISGISRIINTHSIPILLSLTIVELGISIGIIYLLFLCSKKIYLNVKKYEKVNDYGIENKSFEETAMDIFIASGKTE